jgi:hypothetical protein
MTTQNIYSSSYLRRITAADDTGNAGNAVPEKDSTGLVTITMDLTTSYVTRVTALLKQLMEAKTEDQKGLVIARINVIRQELSFITGAKFESIQMTVAATKP